MRDLLLWRLLIERRFDDPRFVPLLDELAAAPMRDRVLFLGPVAEAMSCDDRRIQCFTLRALAGAGGSTGFRIIVRALFDADADVREAALVALRTSSKQDPARWVHALFHPDSAVRRAALAGEPVPRTAAYPLFLFADPECRDLVRERLEGRDLPAGALSAICDFVERGIMPRDEARRLIADMSLADCHRWLATSAVRTEDQQREIINSSLNAADERPLLAIHSHDGLDAVLELFWDDAEDGGRASAETNGRADSSPFASRIFFDNLFQDVLNSGTWNRLRVVASILMTAARKGCWHPSAARLCTVVLPGFLLHEWVPVAVRKASIQGLYDRQASDVGLTDDFVCRLIDLPVCRRPSGNLDLWAVGGILYLFAATPYAKLQAHVGVGKIVSAFLEDVEASAPFFRHDDRSRLGRDFLIQAVCNHRRPIRLKLYAILIHHVPADGYAFLDPLNPEESATVCRHVFEYERDRGVWPSENKIRRSCEVLGERVSRNLDAVETFLQTWLSHDDPQEFAVGTELLTVVSRARPGARFVAVARRLEDDVLKKLLVQIAWCPGFPYGVETALAREFENHADPEVRRWAADRAAESSSRPVRPRPAAGTIRPLPADLAREIASCTPADLSTVVGRCLSRPATGLTAALSARTHSPVPSVTICTALLASHDALEDVDRVFMEYCYVNREFQAELDRRMAAVWNAEDKLPLIGHAWLYRWERHLFAFMRDAQTLADGMAGLLRNTNGMKSMRLTERIWRAAARSVAVVAAREKPRLTELWDAPLAEAAADGLSRMWSGESAARLIKAAANSGVNPLVTETLKRRVVTMLPDLSDKVLAILADWIDVRGLAGTRASLRPVKGEADADLLAEIGASDDLERLREWCCDANAAVADEAAMRLLELGEPGFEQLAAVLRTTPAPPAATVVAETVSLWPDGRALELAEDVVRDESASPVVRFLAGCCLHERGAADLRDLLVELACTGGDDHWFRPEDWDRLIAFGLTESELAVPLAVSPQPHAYTRAVEALLSARREALPSGVDTGSWSVDLLRKLASPYIDVPADAHTSGIETARWALAAFLETGTTRMQELRSRAAAWLFAFGDRRGFPLVVVDVLREVRGELEVLKDVSRPVVMAVVESALIAGVRLINEKRLFAMLANEVVDDSVREEAFEDMLPAVSSDTVREWIVDRLKQKRGSEKRRKLRRIAENFAWGVDMGRQLTGRLFSIEMIAGDDLGYTRLEENRVWVNPLPILKREQHGRDVVQALILHEFGHHMYHRGEEEQELWRTADNEGVGRLLNLVADEHLERNLRAMDDGFGDRLKRLAAYAFQHTSKEIAVEQLFDTLHGRTFEVLIKTRLGVARRRGCVSVDNGKLLIEMERVGMSFARFVRTLRMGLGNRHNDPKVGEALELFKRSFRRSSMSELLEITRRLREIFGWETVLLESLGQDAAVCGDPSDLLIHGEGITAAEVEQEIERVRNPRRRDERDEGDGGRGRWINISDEDKFETISTVVPVPYDRAEHRRYAREIARPARRLRRYLKELGIALEPQRGRTRGKSIDRTRIPAVVLRGDPRMLIAREPRVRTDLFLGVVIDCSGSMQFNEHIETAKKFGALLAEACTGFSGIDLRLFGFTDSVIYDAGDAARPAVHALEAGGGNNDAAALWHAAQTAMSSRRRAKLLVMISDGLPTECSVESLRQLVNRLTHRNRICCAQVAVQRLEEVCFPHYVLLDAADPEACIREFGSVVARLVRRTLSAG